jgi:hypothetical protein
MPAIALSILSLLQYAPQAINEIMAVYAAVKGDLSATDQATIDAALLAAQNADTQATASADAALDTAAGR